MNFFSRCTLRLVLLLGMTITVHAAFALDCAQPQTQADMNACAAQDLNAADTELNQTYIAVRAQLNPAQRNQIRDVQLAWIKYRDLSCRFQSSASVGGSANAMVLQGCLTDKTRQRTRELKALASCQEGDISCVR